MQPYSEPALLLSHAGDEPIRGHRRKNRDFKIRVSLRVRDIEKNAVGAVLFPNQPTDSGGKMQRMIRATPIRNQRGCQNYLLVRRADFLARLVKT